MFVYNDAGSYLRVVEKLLARGDVFSRGAQSVYMGFGGSPVGTPRLRVEHVAYSFHLVYDNINILSQKVQTVPLEKSTSYMLVVISKYHNGRGKPKLISCHQLKNRNIAR